MRRIANLPRLLRIGITAAVTAILTPPPVVGGAPQDAPARDISRIVSVGGAVTEILYALGLESNVVALDTSSVYPERALAEKPNVGYMRQLSPEGILALSPSLILASDGAGPNEAIAVLRAADVPLVFVPDAFTGPGIVEKIRAVARAVGRRERGECMAEVLNEDLAALAAERARIARPLKVMFVLSFANDRAMVAGLDTAADAIIRLAGATNAVEGFRGYKLVNDEAVVAAMPDAVLMMQRPQQTVAAETVFARPAFAMTPAAGHKRFVSMEGLYLLGFGPRTARAARDLAARLYPGAVIAALPSEHQAAETCRP